MNRLVSKVAAAATLCLFPALAPADEVKTYEYDGAFEDATFGVESAIVNRGLVIDFTSNVGDMLARTKEDVGGTEDLFDGAQVFLFCSATLSRKVMEADLANIGYCPYGVFVAQPTEGGPVRIGYRTMPEGPMKEVEALLDAIAQEAADE
jgi:uncharacterized protein (DUF302 family)